MREILVPKSFFRKYPGWTVPILAAAAGLALVDASLGSLGAPAPAASSTLPAFPGAEGFGSHTPGGRGGRVIEVTHRGAEGPGSLRAAVEATGPRIVVFRVGGIIDLEGGLAIRNPFITIAGQTAPGDGICLANGPLTINTHDVVVRYLRVRPGDGPGGGNPENRDCLGIAGPGDQVHNVIVDHCSFSWGLDENVQTWYGPRDITVQWCISSESLDDSLHPKGPHGKGMILGSEDNTITVHHCLLAHNSDRNPLINSGSEDGGQRRLQSRTGGVRQRGRHQVGELRRQYDQNGSRRLSHFSPVRPVRPQRQPAVLPEGQRLARAAPGTGGGVAGAGARRDTAAGAFLVSRPLARAAGDH
jgi:hypothetical protein